MLIKKNHNNLNISLAVENNNFIVDVIPYMENGIDFIKINIKSLTKIRYPKIILDIEFPFIEIHNLWTPSLHGNPKTLRLKGIPEWWCYYSSHISNSAPAGCFYSQSGQNKLTFSFSDSQNIIKIHAGSYEEQCLCRLRLEILEFNTEEISEYNQILRLDRRDISFTHSMQDMSRWFNHLESELMSIPLQATEPVYSTWYSFHQNLDQKQIENQCEIAHKLGCNTLIVDDGWQTDDNNRGYKYCGDWEISSNRFIDFKKHVNTIKSIGVNYVLWLSVPFIGRKSKIWNNYKDNILFYNHQFDAGVLDPRYPKVRNYLIQKFTTLVKDYNLDGLKLDFIDEFDISKADERALITDNDRDMESLPDAVNRLLFEIKERLTEINPNIIIEFRQSYIGPTIRKYGNLFRVHDCPNDSITNRIGIIDLRLLSDKTPIHSDMLTWSPNDSLESISFQFINILFAVPQISPNFDCIPKEQLKLIKHWLSFWKNHKDILLDGELNALFPEMNYPIITSCLNGKEINVIYSNNILNINSSNKKEIIIINGYSDTFIYIDNRFEFTANVSTYNCLGNIIKKEKIKFNNNILKLEIPRSGYIILSII